MRVLIPNLSAQDTQDEEILKQAVIDSYNDLFEQLNTEYGTFFAGLTPPLTVNNIVTFYRGIRAIMDDGTQGIPKPRYFRLPLDEPEFVINMDTRTITVPKVFSDYGFGVKGDANAEVVFFKCDRYYDGVDLGAMTPNITDNNDPTTYNCVVQWQNLASGEAGNSQVILADTEEDSIIFGWMITNKMTSRPGTIEFAVRWTQMANGTITYSISTQKASCAVKSTIDLDYDTLGVDNVADIIYTRPFYSGIINSMKGSSPQVTTGLTAAIRNLVPFVEPTAVDELDPGYEDYLAAKEEYDELVEQYPDGTLELTVAASSPDGHDIVFQWYNGENIIHGATEASYTVVAPGEYYVKIGNDGTADGVGIRYVTSETVTVPAPDQIKFESQNWFGMGTYSDNVAEHTLGVEVKNVKGENPNGSLKYIWKRAAMISNQNTEIKLADITDASYEVVNGANDATYLPPVGDEAYYKCEVVNKLNNTSSNVLNTAEPAVIRAIPVAPESVTIIFDSENQMLKVQSINWGGAPATYHPNEIRYEWGSLADGTYSSSVGYGDTYKNFSVAGLSLKNGATWDSDFYCKVQHVVFRNNNGGQEKQSAQKTSGLLTLHIRLDENNQVTVVGN